MAFEVRVFYEICLIFYKNEINFDPQMCLVHMPEGDFIN